MKPCCKIGALLLFALWWSGAASAAVISLDQGSKTLSRGSDITDAIEGLDSFDSSEEPGARSIFSVDYDSLQVRGDEDRARIAELSNLIKAHSFEKAIELIDQIQADEINNPNFSLIKAQIALMNDDMHTARASARRAIKIAKDFIRGYKFLAYVYMRMEDWRRAKIVLLAALEQAPEDVEIFVLASYAFQGDGEPAEALRLLEKSVEVNPDSSVAFEKLGVALFAAGDVERAKMAYIRAIQLDKQNARAYVGLGTVCIAKGWIQDALTAYSVALERDPNNSDAMTNLGVLAFRSGQVSEGLELVCRGYLAKSGSPNAWDNLIITLSELFPLRASDFATLSLDGISALSEDQRHYQWALYLSQRPGMREAAYRHMLRAAFLNRQHPEIANDLGAMFATERWLYISKALFTKALTLHPTYVEARNNLDQVEEQIEAAEKAKKGE